MNDSARFNSQKAILEKYVKLFPNECWQDMLDILNMWIDSQELIEEEKERIQSNMANSNDVGHDGRGPANVS